MALPTSPVPASEPQAKRPVEASPPERGLPTLPSAPARVEEKKPAAEVEKESDWVVDPHTGVRHRKLPGFDPEAVSANARAVKAGKQGLSLDQLRSYTEEADFDVDDLNGAAEQFLAHLRVPVPQEELLAARAKRKARLQKSDD